MNVVRNNLMTEKGYTPYCGNDDCTLSLPRTSFNGEQFVCGCGWESQFEEEFMQEYKEKWGLPTTTEPEEKRPPCKGCSGIGTVGDIACDSCKGSGYAPEEKRYFTHKFADKAGLCIIDRERSKGVEAAGYYDICMCRNDGESQLLLNALNAPKEPSLNSNKAIVAKSVSEALNRHGDIHKELFNDIVSTVCAALQPPEKAKP